MFSAMGTEARLRIMQLLLSAHPEGLVVGEIQEELEIPNSTLSHHLDKLKNEGLVEVRREGTFLRYTANTDALQVLLQICAAPETRHSSHKTSFRFADRRLEMSTTDIDIKEIVKEKYGQSCAPREKSGGSSCCGASSGIGRAAIRSRPISTMRPSQ